MPEDVTIPSSAAEENNESLLRSLFRLMRTMDNEPMPAEKPLQATAGRRA